MEIYYYHKDSKGGEVAAIYNSWQEADADAAAYLEEYGYAIEELTDIPMHEAWTVAGEELLNVPPQYFVNDELVLEKAEAYGYKMLADLIKANIG